MAIRFSSSMCCYEKEEEGEDGEGQVEIQCERGELKKRRTWMTLGMK